MRAVTNSAQAFEILAATSLVKFGSVEGFAGVDEGVAEEAVVSTTLALAPVAKGSITPGEVEAGVVMATTFKIPLDVRSTMDPVAELWDGDIDDKGVPGFMTGDDGGDGVEEGVGVAMAT